jgi:Uma2 family endonuclease
MAEAPDFLSHEEFEARYGDRKPYHEYWYGEARLKHGPSTSGHNEVMAAATHFLSVREFEALYGDRKPYYEYWYGEVHQKSMPTYLHGILQAVLILLLVRRGYVPAAEVRLNLSELAHPIPDLIAHPTALKAAYPTAPFELAIEIMSPTDELSRTVNKAAHYLDWKIQHVWIIDPEARIAYQMSADHPQPIVAAVLTAGPGLAPIALDELWREVDAMLAPAS